MTEIIDHSCDVRGLGFRLKRDVREILGRMTAKKPMPLVFEREPDNKYHANAIKVSIADVTAAGEFRGIHIGYIAAPTADVLAPKMDEGSVEITLGKLSLLYANDDNKTGLISMKLKK